MLCKAVIDTIMSTPAILVEASLSDFLWILARRASAHNQAIPGWPGVVSMTARDVDTVTQQSTVDYMPPVLHSVTENSTVQHILQLSMQATTELQYTG